MVMEKLIICVALTGNLHTKADNPNLPEKPDEIIKQAYECWEAGASIVHVHARDEQNRSTTDVNIFREIIEGIREKCDAIICVSTGGAATIPLEKRLELIPTFKPELASFSVGSGSTGRYDFEERKWIRDFVLNQKYSDLEYISRTMLENGTKPELEIYDTGFISNVMLLKEIGALKEPLHFNFVMGIPGQCILPTPKNLLHLVESIPPNSTWQAAGVGRYAFPIAAVTIVLGGHVRVGMEDSIYISKGELAKSNTQFVEKVVRMADDIGREIATPKESCKIINITR
jgi:3-keto-5-aminohexanoate cleavage enzyme